MFLFVVVIMVLDFIVYLSLVGTVNRTASHSVNPYTGKNNKFHRNDTNNSGILWPRK